MPRIIFITGVSGVGKSTIGKLLADKLSLPFLEGDDFHPKANLDKMASKEPLNDEDREPWLLAIKQAAIHAAETRGAVISCSALKSKYRELLEKKFPAPLDWVHLLLDKSDIKSRLENRKTHFMPPELLDSQFNAFEKPTSGLQIKNDAGPEIICNKILNELSSSIGIVGLGVMGKSLCRNFASKGVLISMFNREAPPLETAVAKNFKGKFPELKFAKPFNQLENFVQSLQTPRRILLMVSAGKAVDSLIASIAPLLASGDCIIDAGNSHYKDTERRVQELKKQEIDFLGMGVSGGEKGALLGPAIMPGGDKETFKLIESDFQLIAAKDPNSIPCFGYIGKSAAGHFVKMVHNGIEYAEMQLIAELSVHLENKLSKSEIADLFKQWNKGKNKSYLLEISSKIFSKKEGEEYLLDKILDKAESKGTGSWSVKAAADLGVPIPMINAALTARYFSMFKKVRQKGSSLSANETQTSINLDLETIDKAYFLARLLNHQQGLHLIETASLNYKWNINIKEVCRIWTNGCIIRSNLMETLAQLNMDDSFLLLTKTFSEESSWINELKELNLRFINENIAAPCFSAALSYFVQFTEENSSANLIQAQRDFFGAHTYRRKDKPSDEIFHTEWEK